MAWGVDWTGGYESINTRHPSAVPHPRYAVQSVAYPGFVKGGTSRPFSPRTSSPAPNPDISLPSISLLFSSFPSPPLPSLSFFSGGRGYYTRKIFKIADARRRDLAHSEDQNLISDAVNYCQCNKL
jgi:hypothetical protein